MSGPMLRERPAAGHPRRVLLTGATGYIGGRLLGPLEEADHAIRCLARRPEHVRGRCGPRTEVVGGDVLDPDSLAAAFEGIEIAYYLVHSMGTGRAFAERDRRAAENFARAAARAGVSRIVYLGGLGGGAPGRGARPPSGPRRAAAGTPLSPHLASRQETGRILRESGVPAIELRASIVIGSGSLSFEMIRSLVEKLPVMITPKWVRTPAQPIAVEDVISYLIAALEAPPQVQGIFEIGGADQVSYGGLMREYARQRGLRRLMLPVPVLTPWLSSLWLGLVTPLYARIGRELIEGIRNASTVNDPSAPGTFAVRPRDHREAIARALANEDREFARTRWSDALSSRGEARSYGGVKFGSRLVDSRAAHIDVEPERAFRVIERIGGGNGWYAGRFLWQVRGLLDLAAGGAGMRRGRRDPRRLNVGDPVDFWRVEAIRRGRLLRLIAEMRLPGRAWLQFEVAPEGRGCAVRQTALFDPLGVGGRLYWYALYPVHELVFAGMLRGIARAALAEEGEAA